jgi:hypothetical protein
MDTLRPKYSLGLKLILGAVLLLVALVVELFYLDLRDFAKPPMKVAAESPLIVLACVDTNSAAKSWVISEIWRQPAGVSLPAIKVGAKLPNTWASDAGAPPDGVVICYRRTFPLIEAGRFSSQAEFFIRQGRIDNMTIKEFKSACGL